MMTVRLPTAVKLVEIAKEQHEVVSAKARKEEKANEKRIAELTAKEKELEGQIDAGKKQLEKMISQFEVLEKQTAIRNLEEVKENALTVEDVKAGKISMTEFYAKGMKDEDIEKAVIVKTQVDVEKISDTIREKATDVIRLELSLAETKNTVHRLMLNPVRQLLSTYAELRDMLAFQLSPLAEESHSSLNEKVQKEHELMLIDKGMSVAGGYTWPNITLEQGYRLRLDPVLPKAEIPSLLEKLADIDASDTVRITVSFRPKGSFFPGDPIEVRLEKE